MEHHESRIAHAIANTQVLRPPRQALATFGVTVVRYYLVTQPSYADLMSSGGDTVIREGSVSAEQPQVVTPHYMLRLEGFSDQARRYFEEEAQRAGANAAGLLYSYRNEMQGTNIVSGDVASVGRRLAADLDRKGERLAAVIQGIDDLWDISLLKFIYELTQRSVLSNVTELHERGLLEVDTGGVPRSARRRIEELFQEARRGSADPATLKRELDRWGLFEEYQDRFFALFRRR